MPWKDDNQSPVYLDIRRFIPVGDVFDLGQGHAALPIPPALMPGGPLALIGEIIANRSMFTGRPITLETDTAAEQARKLLDYVYKAFAPHVTGLPGSWASPHLSDATNGKTNAIGREQSVAKVMASSLCIHMASYPQNG